MKTSIKLFALGMILMGFGVNVNAQVSSTATATTNARIVTPILLTNQTSLSFGNLISSATAGNVQMPADASPIRVADPGVKLAAITGTYSAAKFTVSGEDLLTYTVTLPADDVIELISGTDKMKLTGFTSSALGTLSGTPEVFYVGATLQVGAGQATGTYSGSFNVTVNYN